MTENHDVPDEYEALAGKHVSAGRILALFRPYRLQFTATVLLMP